MGQGTILIVDDDPDISEAMKIVLESHGFTVDTAADSKQGLAAIQARTPGVIILDVMMNTPREGFVFSRELKSSPLYKDIPILMLTSVKDKTGIDFKSDAGDDTWLPVDEFLDKPVQPDILISKIESLLG